MASKEKLKEEIETLRIELGHQEQEEAARIRDEVYSCSYSLQLDASPTTHQKETRTFGCVSKARRKQKSSFAKGQGRRRGLPSKGKSCDNNHPLTL